MKRSLSLLLPALAVLFFLACNKTHDGLNTVTPGTYPTLDDIFARTALPATTASFKVASGARIVSSGGTVVYFPIDAFQTYGGQIVTGSVDVKLQDWVRQGDMTFGKVLPVSDNQAMATSGQLYIEVTQNGKPVRLRQNYYAIILFPQYGLMGSSDQLYLGRKVIGSVNTVNWYGIDTAGRFNYTLLADTVAMRTDSLYYIAASHLAPNSGLANFSVKVNTPVPLEQTLAVASLDGMKAVYPVSSAINNVVYAQQIPVNPLHLAVMGVNKGVFYAGIVPIASPATDSTYEVQLKQVDPQDFRATLNALQ
ncbi:MAG: hypothetical protein JST27_06870 [Bacteroidetes bacterium]|nr:hypothetical protein [Bacteroidota bacterium]